MQVVIFIIFILHNIVLLLAENLFNITVYTADLKLAGTTSRVYINIYGMLYGLEESTAKLHLTNHNHKEFSRGRWDLMIHLLLDLVNKSLGRHFRFWRFFTHARQTVAREWNYTCPVPRATHLQFWTRSTACGKPFTYVLNTSETWYHLLHSFIVNLSFTCLRN